MNVLDPEVKPVLTLEKIYRSFTSAGQTLKAVDGVSLSLDYGEILGLVGESGSGKSTVGRIASGLETLKSGRVLIEGEDVALLSRRELVEVRRKCQMVFQDPYSSLNPRLKVGRQVAESLRGAGWRDPIKMRIEIERLFELVGLTAQQIDRYPHEFSGGQRQRIAIARALAPSPKMIVADEPVSSLDVTIQAQILALISRLCINERLAILFISHDIAVVAHICHRIAVMHRGRVLEIGSATDIVSDARHTYTQMLLSSVPRLDRRRQGVQTYAKEIPSPKDQRYIEVSGNHWVLES